MLPCPTYRNLTSPRRESSSGIGNSPRRIDIITRISGVDFERAYANSQIVSVEGMDIPVISLQDLIANKRASGRPQDLVDLEKLQAASKKPG